MAHHEAVDGRRLAQGVGDTDAAPLGIRDARRSRSSRTGSPPPAARRAARAGPRRRRGRRPPGRATPARRDGALARERRRHDPLVGVVDSPTSSTRGTVMRSGRPSSSRSRLARERGLGVARPVLDVPPVVGAEGQPAVVVAPHRVEPAPRASARTPLGHGDAARRDRHRPHPARRRARPAVTPAESPRRRGIGAIGRAQHERLRSSCRRRFCSAVTMGGAEGQTACAARACHNSAWVEASVCAFRGITRCCAHPPGSRRSHDTQRVLSPRD